MEYYVKSIIPILKMNYDKFTPLEKTIADFFISNREKVDLSSKAMAERLYISEASLSRFAKNADITDIANLSINMNPPSWKIGTP